MVLLLNMFAKERDFRNLFEIVNNSCDYIHIYIYNSKLLAVVQFLYFGIKPTELTSYY